MHKRNGASKRRSTVKKLIRSLVVMGAAGGWALFSTQPGFAQGTPFYITGGIGPALTADTDLKEFPGVGRTPGRKVEFDPGVQFRVAFGYHLTDWLATEVETGFTYNTIRSITGADIADASLANAPVLANLV